jgi:hypothetical protein
MLENKSLRGQNHVTICFKYSSITISHQRNCFRLYWNSNVYRISPCFSRAWYYGYQKVVGSRGLNDDADPLYWLAGSICLFVFFRIIEDQRAFEAFFYVNFINLDYSESGKLRFFARDNNRSHILCSVEVAHYGELLSRLHTLGTKLSMQMLGRDVYELNGTIYTSKQD